MTPLETDHGKGLNGALAAEMRAEIAAQKRTNTEVADTAGLKRVPFQRWINAERAITTATADAICEALGVDTGEMYARAVKRLQRVRQGDELAARRVQRVRPDMSEMVADSNVDEDDEG